MALIVVAVIVLAYIAYRRDIGRAFARSHSESAHVTTPNAARVRAGDP